MEKTSELVVIDPWLAPYNSALLYRTEAMMNMKKSITKDNSLVDCTRDFDFMGLHKKADGSWDFTEWAPAATSIYFLCDANGWKDSPEYCLQKTNNGLWEINISADRLKHESLYKLHIFWDGGDGYRVPAWTTRTVQDSVTHDFSAQVWDPINKFSWKNNFVRNNQSPIIYEAHIGMASEQEKVSSYSEFTQNILPYIKELGYNTIQIMGIQEHPYYGSFGYHVSSFFAASSRFGTPDELKELIDTAHKLGIAVIMDLVHSHAVKNELEGLSRFDGTYYQYFHDGARGNHPAWDSRCFNYSKPEVIKFLLSNCHYWISEYHMDGFRFDGVTSMLYKNHGLEKDFTHYDDYFNEIDPDAISYLSLANQLIHELNPNALTIAEEMSGMPGVAATTEIGGLGFDYRLSMGIPDMWIKIIKEQVDEKWIMSKLLHELTQHRPEEKTISYVESHDQALVGDKTVIFRLIDKDMYFNMSIGDTNLIVDRGLALHKMIRLLTSGTNSGGYLAFMGNEFGHPEWIDFPREGNNWSYKYARRQWKLAKNNKLAYKWLLNFDIAMVEILKNIEGYISYTNAHDENHVISFCRGDYLFVFNFHPDKSFTDYGIPTIGGKYELILSSDSLEFGGSDRIKADAPYQTVPVNSGDNLRLYLPARTCSVYKIVK